MDVQEKVVVITGASAGIGLATARRFATAKAKVVMAARSGDKMETVAEELQANGAQVFTVPTDMRNPEAVKQLVESTIQHFGRIDILVNNAGQSVAGRIADLDTDHFQEIIALNLFGPLYAMQAVIPAMRQNGGGLIINISSMVSKMSIPGLAGYASTKAALNLISDTARGELATDNIRVISVFPGVTATDFGKNALGNQQLRQQQRGSMPTNIVPDSAEFVADKILEAAQNEPAEQYMHS